MTTAMRDTPGMTDRSLRVSRRTMLAGGVTAASGVAAGAAGAVLFTGEEDVASAPEPVAVEAFHGNHQAGIATPPQAHAAFLSLSLKSGIGLERFASVQKLLSQDAERLTQGEPPLGDTEPELAKLANRLTITFGFGYELFDKLAIADRRPGDFTKLPKFELDRLDEKWNGGDVLLQICADDATTVAHALRMCVKDSRSIAKVRWVMRGFRQAPPVIEAGATPRNTMGQLDGTANPAPGGEAFAETVWRDGDDPTKNGSILVVRRIRTELETWDAVDPAVKEMSIGRALDTGAPLTGKNEHDEPDFDATNDLGFTVIPPKSHIRRAQLEDGRQIFRRAYNYDDQVSADGTSDTGLIFASYQKDIATFADIQAQLDNGDMLNDWVTAIGSSEFLIPPGCQPGGWVGETLFG